MRVLIVDDCIGLADGLQYYFERRHHTALVAHNGLDALTLVKIQEQPFDLILMDLLLKETTGIEVIAKIKRILNGSLKKPVYIGMTGKIDSEIDDYEHLGFDAIIIKPFELKDLADLIQSELARKGA